MSEDDVSMDGGDGGALAHSLVICMSGYITVQIFVLFFVRARLTQISTQHNLLAH